MKRILASLALLAAPMTASAGVGFTAHQTWDHATRTHAGTGSGWGTRLDLPTLDIVNEGLVIQLGALDLVEALTYETVDLNVSVFKTVKSGPVNGDWKGVLQPGGTLEFNSSGGFNFDPMWIAAIGKARMGFQKAEDFGFGLYVVPGLGIAYGADEIDLAVSGGLQVSAWMK
ncbi:hypothetical protein L6R53_24155 [Myxococcota bacterium]|nr:hypothetical protein [Myxococcota bacterium]